MSKEQFEREWLYQASAAIARTMLHRGLLTQEEYCRFDTILLEKYRPVLGSFQAQTPPKNLDK